MAKTNKWWPKGFRVWKDKKPPFKQRCQHRKSKVMVDLSVFPPGSPEFNAECDRIAKRFEPRNFEVSRAGTFGAILRHYFASEHFQKNLRERTQKDYRKVADFLLPLDDVPIHKLQTPLISRIHSKASEKNGWRRANMLLTVMTEAFKHAIPEGLIKGNPAKGVILCRDPNKDSYANRPWSPQECINVLDNAPPHLKVAISLMMFTGLDPSDALRLRKDQIIDGTIQGFRGKTGTVVGLPISPFLQSALNSAPKHNAETVLAKINGNPWTYSGFSTVWGRFKNSLEKDGKIGNGLTLKGLRHTMATRLREAGVSDRDIADVLGQKSLAMPRYYSRSAELARKNQAAIDIFENEIGLTGKVSNSHNKVSNPENKKGSTQ